MSEDNVQNVEVTNMMPLNVRVSRIDIPFEDIFWLTFKSAVAGIILILIPAFIISGLTTESNFTGGASIIWLAIMGLAIYSTFKRMKK
tara:strand:- start:220 stop:483 length:264 start_codon:yes stop_codon:yes gene_type:complete